MDIQTRKLEFIQSFLKLQSEEVLTLLELVLKRSQENEATEDLKPLSIQELNDRIFQSEKDFEKGDFKTTSELLAKYQ